MRVTHVTKRIALVFPFMSIFLDCNDFGRECLVKIVIGELCAPEKVIVTSCNGHLSNEKLDETG